jgi:hypothetical protein
VALEATAAGLADPLRAVKIRAPVVLAGYGITAPEYGYYDYKGIDARGKIVAVQDHEPDEDNPDSPFNGRGFTIHANAWTKTLNAQRHGAVALLIVSDSSKHPRTTVRAANRGNAPPQSLVDNELKIPRFVLAESAMAQLRNGLTVELEAENQPAEPQPSWNVAGLLEGSDPALRAETVLVTAHYDHLGARQGLYYPGANDNGSGVAGLLEIARLMAGEANRPSRSVLFVAFGSEEQLLLGSYYYTAHPLRPLATTRAVVNLDMIARSEDNNDEGGGTYEVPPGTANELNLVGGVFAPTLRSAIERANQGIGLRLSDRFDKESATRALFRCDHLPFLIHGVPAIWLFGGWHSGYHTPDDTLQKIDVEKLQRVTRLAWQTTLEVAGAK